MPAVLIEAGYLTNAEDERLLLSVEGQELAAQAIVEGLKDYFTGSERLSYELQAKGMQINRPGPSKRTGYPSMEKMYFNGSAKDGKQVALTFDDGPDAVVTPQILDILKEHHIKATFSY